MSKASSRCVGFEFSDLKMTLHGIGVHVHGNGAAWAVPPAQAIIKNGAVIKDERGKVQYSPPLLEFASAEIRRAWSDCVVAEVLAYDPCALECREESAA